MISCTTLRKYSRCQISPAICFLPYTFEEGTIIVFGFLFISFTSSPWIRLSVSMIRDLKLREDCNIWKIFFFHKENHWMNCIASFIEVWRSKLRLILSYINCRMQSSFSFFFFFFYKVLYFPIIIHLFVQIITNNSHILNILQSDFRYWWCGVIKAVKRRTPIL